jgi:hypothetical protein
MIYKDLHELAKRAVDRMRRVAASVEGDLTDFHERQLVHALFMGWTLAKRGSLTVCCESYPRLCSALGAQRDCRWSRHPNALCCSWPTVVVNPLRVPVAGRHSVPTLR